MRFAEMLTRSLNLVRCWLLGWCGLLDNWMLDCFLNPGRCPPYRSYCRLLLAVPRVWYCLRSRVWFWIGRSGDRGLSPLILECKILHHFCGTGILPVPQKFNFIIVGWASSPPKK